VGSREIYRCSRNTRAGEYADPKGIVRRCEGRAIDGASGDGRPRRQRRRRKGAHGSRTRPSALSARMVRAADGFSARNSPVQASMLLVTSDRLTAAVPVERACFCDSPRQLRPGPKRKERSGDRVAPSPPPTSTT